LEFATCQAAGLRIGVDDDQAPLQALLAQMTPEERDGLLPALSNGEVNYNERRYIQHFIRTYAQDWTSPANDLQRRITWMQSSIKQYAPGYLPWLNIPVLAQAIIQTERS
jgi:hypothetical protein